MFLGMSEHDTVATITTMIAKSIVTALRDYVQDSATVQATLEGIVVCGKGARNAVLVGYLRKEMRDVPLTVFQSVDTGRRREDASAAAAYGAERASLCRGVSTNSSLSSLSPRSVSPEVRNPNGTAECNSEAEGSYLGHRRHLSTWRSIVGISQ